MPTLWSYGDSWTASDTYNTPGQRAIEQLASRLGLTVTNHAQNGDMIGDGAEKSIGGTLGRAYAPGSSDLVLSHFTNDLKSTDDAQKRASLRHYLRAHYAVLSAAERIEESTATKTGTWSTNSGAWFPSGGQNASTTQNGATATFTVTTPGRYVLLLFGTRGSAVGGIFTISQGGVTLATVDTDETVSAVERNANNVGPLGIELGNLVAGDLLVSFSTAGRSGASGFLDALVRIDEADPPTVLAVKPVTVTYTGPPTYVKPDLLADIRAAIDTVAAEFPNVIVCDPLPGWNTATMLGADGLHPNDTGMTHLADAMEASLTPPDPPVGLSAAATTTTTVAVEWTPGAGSTASEVRLDGGPALPADTPTSHTFTGLAASTGYTVEVRATNAAGESAWVSLAVTTDDPPPPLSSGDYATHLRVGSHAWDVSTVDSPDYGPLAGLRFTWSARQDDGWPTQHEPTVLVFGVVVEAGTDFDDVDQGTPVHFTFTPDGYTGPLVEFGGTVRDLVGRPHPLGMVYNITAVDHLQALREDYTSHVTATNGEATTVVWERMVQDADGAGAGIGTRPYLPDPLAGDVPPGNGWLGADLLLEGVNTWTLMRGIAAAYVTRPDTFPVLMRALFTYVLDSGGNLDTAHPYEGTWVTHTPTAATELDGGLLVTDAAEWSRPRIEPNRVEGNGWAFERPHTGPDVVRVMADGTPFMSDATDPGWVLAGVESPDQWSTALRLLAARDAALVADWFTLPAAMRVFVSIDNIDPRHTPTGSGVMEGLLSGASLTIPPGGSWFVDFTLRRALPPDE